MISQGTQKDAVNTTPDIDGAVNSMLNFLVEKRCIDTMTIMRSYNLNRGGFEKCLELAKNKFIEKIK